MKKKKILIFFLIIFVLMSICTYSFAWSLNNPIMRVLTTIYRFLQVLVLGLLIIAVSILGIMIMLSPFIEAITPEAVKDLRKKLFGVILAGILLFSIQALIDAIYSYVNAEEEEEAFIVIKDTIYTIANLNK